MRHPNTWIVSLGRGRGHKYQACTVSGCPTGFFNETPANSPSLIFDVYRQIGQVTAIREIRYGPRDADETVVISSGHDEICMT
jgi:hypothetical protein